MATFITTAERASTTTYKLNKMETDWAGLDVDKQNLEGDENHKHTSQVFSLTLWLTN
jgi:hypothetical protein